MAVQFKKATKKKAKARVGISGPAGAGKTFTALRLATTMCDKVAVIDTEHGSASKYADLFEFDVLELDDFHPDNYIKAIKAAQEAGYEALVIDSITHEWNGVGGCIDLLEVAKRKWKGNSYAAWGDITPLHNRFIEAILASKMHIFATMRSKMDYLQTEDSNGKKKVEKVGMAPITREGVEYEFDIVGEIDLNHSMMITKTRCHKLADKIFTKPGEDLANEIKSWLDDGTEPTPEEIEKMQLITIIAKVAEDKGYSQDAINVAVSNLYGSEGKTRLEQLNVAQLNVVLDKMNAAKTKVVE